FSRRDAHKLLISSINSSQSSQCMIEMCSQCLCSPDYWQPGCASLSYMHIIFHLASVCRHAQRRPHLMRKSSDWAAVTNAITGQLEVFDTSQKTRHLRAMGGELISLTIWLKSPIVERGKDFSTPGCHQ